MKNWLPLVFLSFFACSKISAPSDPAAVFEHFYFQKTTVSPQKGCVVLLPGSGGLKIFGDAAHYFQIAEKLRQAGFSTLLVDYKSAYKTARRAKKETTGEKICWATEAAIRWAREKKHLAEGEKISLVGWSLAGEGAILLARDAAKTADLGLWSIALFYPSNQKKLPADRVVVPVLVQSGTADNVTEVAEIEPFYGQKPDVETIFYEGAEHGFDVESLKNGRSLRFPPLVGKKYRMQFQAAAAAASFEKLLDFLAQR